MPERLSVFDLAELAADVGPNARNIGVLLELEGPALDAGTVRAVLAARLGLVPRLAQRMRRVPLGAGRPVWQDVVVDLDHHMRTRTSPATDLLALTAAIVSEPLDPARPWWTLTVVDVPDERRSALVWSSHHAMADGPSVLSAVLGLLAHEGTAVDLRAREPSPGRRRLTRDAWAARARALGGVAGWPRRLVGFRELGSSMGQVPASGLNRPVTAGFVLRTVDVELAALRAGARAGGATVNDALLWAWGRAVHRRLAAEGADGPVAASCTVAAPSATLQNRVGVMRVPLPAPGDSVAADLRSVAVETKHRKRRITGASWWLTAQLFRACGALGVYRGLVERQRSITTLVTNLRGPAEPPVVLGRRVTRAVPVATLVGNVTTLAAALSCGDRLVVTVMCAPESATSADALAADLGEGLAAAARLTGDLLHS